jgi:hypothetical protein
MDCRDIITTYLKENKYDGLFQPGTCGCELADLIPCDGDFTSCEPGYKILVTEKDTEWQDCDWIISPSK